MRRVLGILMACCLLVMMTACSADESPEAGSGQTVTAEDAAEDEAASNDDEATAENEEAIEMKLTINDTAVAVKWENNASVKALAKMAEEGPVTIAMSPYGGFEQVGSIGATLPSSDTNIKTKAGDIMLYMGDQMVIFHGANSWAYTRLGKITDKTDKELKDLLGGDGVTVTVTAE